MQQARVKNHLGEDEGDKNNLVWLCHKKPSSLYGWTEIKCIFVTFLPGSLGSMGAVEELNKARVITLLLSIPAHCVVPSA